MTFENIIAFIKKHKAMLGLGAIGLEIAFLMLVIGFFQNASSCCSDTPVRCVRLLYR